MNIEKQVDFLIFWGKRDRESVIHMPLWKRKWTIEQTIENLKILYGKNNVD